MSKHAVKWEKQPGTLMLLKLGFDVTQTDFNVARFV